MKEWESFSEKKGPFLVETSFSLERWCPQASPDSPHNVFQNEVCWTADMDPKIPGFFHFLLFMTRLDTFCHPNAPRIDELDKTVVNI